MHPRPICVEGHIGVMKGDTLQADRSRCGRAESGGVTCVAAANGTSRRVTSSIRR